jgi:putative flavoprotein involved in K+ transport
MTDLPQRVHTVVIGAGQAGLTMSWHLQRAGREHVLLERHATLGGGWRDRWDEFRLVTPNWTVSFPGMPYDGADPDGFMPRDEIRGRVARYAEAIAAPVVLEARVEGLRSLGDGGFALATSQGPLVAREVIVATGGFHVPHVPDLAAGLSSRVHSLHAHAYRRESDLPPGAVLIVGSGQTGVQLTEELREAGRAVFLCVSAAGRVPRRYRGRDIFGWLWDMADRGEDVGAALPSVAMLPDPRRRLAGNPALSGHRGGHETDLRAIGAEGTTLLGRLEAIEGHRIRLGPDLPANLDVADAFFGERFRPPIDAFIAATGVDAPPAEPRLVNPYDPERVQELDLDAAGISTVIWTTGYRPDLRWIDMPVTDGMGLPRQVRGVSEVPGLYFLGSLWLHDQTSATLIGLQRDARVLARRMGLAPDRDRGA